MYLEFLAEKIWVGHRITSFVIFWVRPESQDLRWRLSHNLTSLGHHSTFTVYVSWQSLIGKRGRTLSVPCPGCPSISIERRGKSILIYGKRLLWRTTDIISILTLIKLRWSDRCPSNSQLSLTVLISHPSQWEFSHPWLKTLGSGWLVPFTPIMIVWEQFSFLFTPTKRLIKTYKDSLSNI